MVTAVPSDARYNEIGVQHISTHIFKQIFPNGEKPPPKELVELSKEHLRRHDLLGKNTDDNDPIAFDVPPLRGSTKTLDEHFHILGTDCAEPFLGYAKQFAKANIPQRPRKWVRRSGWTKYSPRPENKPALAPGDDPAYMAEEVEAPDPDDKMLSFDVEVMWKESPFAIMACAAGPTNWYVWLSPWLLGESETNNHLVPLGDPTQERIIVGHNIGYDRGRILEEYDLKQSRNCFIDTMSLHVAVNGMCSQQRPTWMKHKKNRELRAKIAKESTSVELANLLDSNSLREEEEELWIERSAVNSLRDVAKFHLDVTIDKAVRNDFGELKRDEIVEKLDELLDYCAADVAVTHRVYQKVFPNFLEVCPHPVSFAALRHLSSVILPVDKSWDAYIANAEATYQRLSDGVKERLVGLAEKALEVKDDPEKWGNDPWLKQLDWSGQEIRMAKGKKKGDPPRPALRQKMPGMPRWYKDLFHKVKSDVKAKKDEAKPDVEAKPDDEAKPDVKAKKDEVKPDEAKSDDKAKPDVKAKTTKAKTAKAKKAKAKPDEVKPDEAKPNDGVKPDKEVKPDDEWQINLTVRTRTAVLLLRLSWDGYPLCWSDKYGWTFKVPLSDMSKYAETQLVRCDFSDEPIEALRNDVDGIFFKLPHKDGLETRCTNPLAKGYLTYFDKGTLSSEYAYAKEALDMNASCSYWISARDRISHQMVVYEDNESITKAKKRNGQDQHVGNQHVEDQHVQGFILPQIIPMGTITRRAVENTWLTASNAKKNRVGSELKAMVKAPPGHCFVGADVDSEELWIASVVGDATFGLHGGNAIGFMTLEGTKAAGTDLHSRTAGILGITRNDAKVFNYGRIYGAGLKFAATLLRQFNPGLPEQETLETAGKLYATTKGTKTNRKALYKRPFWRGGTESFVFNKLEEFAEQERPRTPVLGASITEALMKRYIGKGGYLTSRINWAIQSSGVDYLHLLVVSMDYLIRRFNINARLAITVHDEIRYLVKEEDKYRAAMALQISNLWTRAMFAEQVGIPDLPQSCAYFSAVDIDHVLRKEVDMDCVTPSHSTPIPPGESIDIVGLLEKGDEAILDPSIVPAHYRPKLENIPYTPRIPIMEKLDAQQDPTDLSFLKAQITNDEQELRDILKEQRKKFNPGSSEGSVRKPREKKMRPYSSQAELIPHMYEPFESAKFTKRNYDDKPWVFEAMPPASSSPRNYRGSRP